VKRDGRYHLTNGCFFRIFRYYPTGATFYHSFTTLLRIPNNHDWLNVSRNYEIDTKLETLVPRIKICSLKYLAND